jgi:hypothetical protein
MASPRIHLQSAATAKSDLEDAARRQGHASFMPDAQRLALNVPDSMRPTTSRSLEDLHRQTWPPDRHAVAQFPTGMADIAHHPAPATCIPCLRWQAHSPGWRRRSAEVAQMQHPLGSAHEA